jgi:hypothetical protein
MTEDETMGWDYARQAVSMLPTGDYLSSLFTMDRPTIRQTVTAIARDGATYYLALHVTEPGREPFTTALVVLTEGVPSRPGFGYKAMDERFGPIESRCPAAILDMLSPVALLGDPPGYAQAWRDRCRAHLAQAKAAA